MKACLLRRPRPIAEEPLEVAEVPEPQPAADEALIRVRASGVCRTDLHVVEGELEVRRAPLIPGHQVVGEVVALGDRAHGLRLGERVGVAWLHRTCGACRFCGERRENLCDRPEFTGWTVNGGYAEMIVAPAAFVYPLPAGFGDLEAAPLLCAGIVGFRSLRRTGLWPEGEGASAAGARLGIYGFGAAGHVAIQLARARGMEVYVATRDRGRHQALASELGAAWVGGAAEAPPVKLDAAIIFAPAGEIVPAALAALEKGGTLVLGGIHMSPLPSLDYRLLWGERAIRTVANNTREDGRDFLAEAARIPVRTHTVSYPLAEANRALRDLKHDAVRGAAVLVVE
jgi:propanol-preferring alcohol dehydrogenase